jgi:nucleoid DNA-binding protein
MTNLPSTNITRAHLADAVCRATGLPKADAGGLVEIFLDLISEALLRREPVMISGFGKFIVLERAARKGRNVKLGVNVMIEPRLAIVFKPAPGLVAQLNKHSEEGQTAPQRAATGA